MKKISDVFKLGESYLGLEITEIIKSNLDSLECREVYSKYLDPIDNTHKRINNNVYYKIFYDESERPMIIRDIKRSSTTTDKLKSEKLMELVSSDTSVLGSELIELSNKEMVDTESFRFKSFYHEILSSPRYSPKSNIYYFIKYNSSGRYYLVRDLIKSPRIQKIEES